MQSHLHITDENTTAPVQIPHYLSHQPKLTITHLLSLHPSANPHKDVIRNNAAVGILKNTQTATSSKMETASYCYAFSNLEVLSVKGYLVSLARSALCHINTYV